MTPEDETSNLLAAEQTTSQGRIETVNSPYCCEIRSKRYYFLQEMPTEERHLLDGSKHCWCRQTMQVVGPDGEQARPEHCTPGRACYRSLFELENKNDA